jgi:hypothetical protein
MPDLGDLATATLEVDPFDVTTDAELVAHAPDGTTPAVGTPSTEDDGHTWEATVIYDQVGWWLLAWEVTGTGAGVQHQRVYVSPTPAAGGPPPYATVEDLRGMQNPREAGDPDDPARDALLLRSLATASRLIDQKANRRFYLDDEATARVYGATGRTTVDGLLLVDDIGSEDDLVVETGSTGSWGAVTAPTFGPENALVAGRPLTEIAAATYGFWGGPQVRVTARWGWPAVPDEIGHATLLLANRLYLRASSPDGLAASGEWGAIRLSRWDPDVEALVRPYALPRMP